MKINHDTKEYPVNVHLSTSFTEELLILIGAVVLGAVLKIVGIW